MIKLLLCKGMSQKIWKEGEIALKSSRCTITIITKNVSFNFFSLSFELGKQKKKKIEFASLAPLEIKTYVGQKSFVGLVSYFKWTVFHGCEPTRHYCETTSVFVFEPRYSTRQEHSSPDMAMFSICGGQCVQTVVPQPNIKIKS